MKFVPAVKQCFTKYKDFKRRASRSEYWWFFLFYFSVYIPLFIIDYTMGIIDYVTTLVPSSIGLVLYGYFGLSGLFTLFITLPSIALGVRRLHDRDKSGWWIFAGTIIFVAYLFVAILLVNDRESLFLSISYLLLLVAFIIVFFIVLVWSIQKGTSGDNRFGEDPLLESNTSLKAN